MSPFLGPTQFEVCPLDWALLRNQPNQDLHQFHRWVIQLRHQRPSLFAAGFRVLLADKQRMLFAFERSSSEGELTYVIANLRDDDLDGTAEVRTVAEGTWRDIATGETFPVAEAVLRVPLARSQVRILARA